jgi:hypothetical protein
MIASATTKKTCAKCNKGGGTAMCYGCERAFCTKHFIEHRQELSQQMDNIGQEHDVLRRDLINEQDTHPLLTCINRWEQESITKIQVAAEVARADLDQLLQTAKNNLKTSVSKMKEELQSSRESDDYAELDINKWTDQLQKLRKLLDGPTTINIDYENDTRLAIRLIKVSNQQSLGSSYEVSQLRRVDNQNSPNLETSVNERFVDIFGKITLSEGGVVATCARSSFGGHYVSGIGRYSSGVHHIRFRVDERSWRCYILFGIVNVSEKLTKYVSKSTSCHGWWDLDCTVIGGEGKRHSFNINIVTGDEVTLILDCDNQRIQLKHHRTDRIVEMPIDLQLCAFPWKVIAGLWGGDDCVRILH